MDSLPRSKGASKWKFTKGFLPVILLSISVEVQFGTSLRLSSATFVWSEGQHIDNIDNIFCLSEDRFHSARLLVCAGHSLVYFDIAREAFSTVVGKSDEHGYIEAKGSDVRFYYPKDVIQINASQLIVSDMLNCCIRQVTLDEGEWVTSRLAGGCERQGDVDGSFSSARFDLPNGLLLQNNLIFVTDFNGNQIRLLNLDDRDVTTVLESISQPSYMTCILPTCSHFFVTYSHGLKIVDPIIRSAAIIIDGQGNSTGDLLSTQLNSPTHIHYLTDNLTLLVDHNNERILLIDLLNNESSSLLNLKGVFSIVCHEGTLYVGLSDGRLYRYSLIDLPEHSPCAITSTTVLPASSSLKTDPLSHSIKTVTPTDSLMISGQSSDKSPRSIGTKTSCHLIILLAVVILKVK